MLVDNLYNTWSEDTINDFWMNDNISDCSSICKIQSVRPIPFNYIKVNKYHLSSTKYLDYKNINTNYSISINNKKLNVNINNKKLNISINNKKLNINNNRNKSFNNHGTYSKSKIIKRNN